MSSTIAGRVLSIREESGADNSLALAVMAEAEGSETEDAIFDANGSCFSGLDYARGPVPSAHCSVAALMLRRGFGKAEACVGITVFALTSTSVKHASFHSPKGRVQAGTTSKGISARYSRYHKCNEFALRISLPESHACHKRIGWHVDLS